MGIFGFFRKKEACLYDGADMYCKPPQPKTKFSQNDEGKCKECGVPFVNAKNPPNFSQIAASDKKGSDLHRTVKSLSK